MSEDDKGARRNTLFSKVVKFIKSPTTDWADLESADAGDTSPASDSPLKAMIERKLRNDGIRNQEFDLLRGIRTGGRVDDAARTQLMTTDPVRPSSVPDSGAADDEPEAATAQIGPASVNGAGRSAAHAADDARRLGRDNFPSPAFAPTVVWETGHPPAPGAAHDAASPEVPEPMPEIPVITRPEDDFGRPLIPEPPLTPEIEEASIRFANSDFAGAEAGLLDVLASADTTEGEGVNAWLTLFDLYRATNQQAKFNDRATAFAERFGRSAPQWSAAIEGDDSAMAPLEGDEAPSAPPAERNAIDWRAPEIVNAQALATLNAALARHPAPWSVDWSQVRMVELGALPRLIDKLNRWADSAVSLRLAGGTQLLQVLAEQSPANEREVNPEWWIARLALLRVLDRAEEFDGVALDYCVTYEISPPAWQPPQCQFVALAANGEALQLPDGDADGASLQPAAGGRHPGVDAASGVVRLALEGELRDDAGAALLPLGQLGGAKVIKLDCRDLRRVSFGAAGVLLNWAADQKAQGRRVEFRHVNRLVAAFFEVIGISESTRVVRRAD